MRAYASEHDFSQHLIKTLRGNGFMIQRIETGGTGQGVPDIFGVSPKKRPFWLELKRVRCTVDDDSFLYVKVPWRPGQQAWLSTVSGAVACMTVIAFDNVLGVIRGDYTGSPLVSKGHVTLLGGPLDLAQYISEYQI